MSFVFDGVTTIQCFECSEMSMWWNIWLNLGPRLKTNPSVEHFPVRYTGSDVCTR